MADEQNRQTVATPDDIRAVLQLSDEQIDELRRIQDKALQVFRSRARLTPKERQLGYAVEMERHHRITGDRNALAGALALQGRFAEAVETATREDLKAEYQEKLDAILSDDEDCECPSHTKEAGHEMPTQYVAAYVISEKHGGVLMPAIRCLVCGRLNVRALLPHLAAQREARHSDREVKDFFRK